MQINVSHGPNPRTTHALYAKPGQTGKSDWKTYNIRISNTYVIQYPCQFQSRRRKTSLFGATLLYQLWSDRKKVLYSDESIDPVSFLSKVNRTFLEHYSVYLNRSDPTSVQVSRQELTGCEGNDNTCIFVHAAWSKQGACAAVLACEWGNTDCSMELKDISGISSTS